MSTWGRRRSPLSRNWGLMSKSLGNPVLVCLVKIKRVSCGNTRGQNTFVNEFAYYYTDALEAQKMQFGTSADNTMLGTEDIERDTQVCCTQGRINSLALLS